MNPNSHPIAAPTGAQNGLPEVRPYRHWSIRQREQDEALARANWAEVEAIRAIARARVDAELVQFLANMDDDWR